jgi:hypothetical protein
MNEINDLAKQNKLTLKTGVKKTVAYINDLLDQSNIELPQREDFYNEILENCFLSQNKIDLNQVDSVFQTTEEKTHE